jgi:polyphosphate:AMP phosphotransferase
MLETLDLSASITSEEFDRHRDEIRLALSRAQRRAWQDRLGVLIVVEGWNFSGKAPCVRFLTEPLDPRGFKVHVMYPPSSEERRYPFHQRYWTRIPAYGQTAVFLRSWYYHVIEEPILEPEMAASPNEALTEISQFERMLADDGYLLLKFWLHIDRAELKRRRKQFKKKFALRSRYAPDDNKQHKRWDRYLQGVEEMLARTSTDFARWYPLPAIDTRFAQMSLARTVVERIDEHLAARRWQREHAQETPLVDALPPVTSVLKGVDLTQTLPAAAADQRLKSAQLALNDLQYACLEARRPVIFLFEGWDAAGKGGVIRRLTAELDPRYFTVHPIAAPRGDEADHHYLWRFWQKIPPAGQWAVFDRSWYGRVLVERVEGFASPPAWQRAYAEINAFESALTQSGAILLKFWLHIDQDEQLRRFKERQEIDWKNYKITPEDWRNREKWPQYEVAVEDMVQRTSTLAAPWFLIPANDKHYARVKIMETAIERIKEGLARTHSRLLKKFL